MKNTLKNYAVTMAGSHKTFTIRAWDARNALAIYFTHAATDKVLEPGQSITLTVKRIEETPASHQITRWATPLPRHRYRCHIFGPMLPPNKGVWKSLCGQFFMTTKELHDDPHLPNKACRRCTRILKGDERQPLPHRQVLRG